MTVRPSPKLLQATPLPALRGTVHHQCLIDIQMTFVLRQVALAARLIQQPPLFRGQAHGVLETLEHGISVLGSILRLPQGREGLGESQRRTIIGRPYE